MEDNFIRGDVEIDSFCTVIEVKGHSLRGVYRPEIYACRTKRTQSESEDDKGKNTWVVL